MKTRETKRLVEQIVTVYIAIDGREFDTKEKCENHEAELKNRELLEKAEALRIRELDGIIPLDDHGYTSENNNFAWYRVNSDDDVALIRSLYDDNDGIYNPLNYPEIICVESNGWRDEYEGDTWDYHFTDIKCATMEFYERLGYKVTFEKVEER